MAAVVLPSAAPVSCKTTTSVGTTLQQFTLPSNTGKFSVRCVDAGWLQWDVGSDAGSVTSASAVPLDAGVWYEFDLAQMRLRASWSFYVAAQSSTTTVYVVVEAA